MHFPLALLDHCTLNILAQISQEILQACEVLRLHVVTLAEIGAVQSFCLTDSSSQNPSVIQALTSEVAFS